MITKFSIAADAALCVAAATAQTPPTPGHADQVFFTKFQPKNQARLVVTSPSFTDGGDIPFENTQYRGNAFPGLHWSAGPKGTHSYVVVMQGTLPGRDGRAGSINIHFILFNIREHRRLQADAGKKKWRQT